jgi:hypothetical protein
MKLVKNMMATLLFFSCTVSLFGQNDWVFKKEKDGIKIYTRQANHSKFNDLKVELDLQGTLSQLSSILLDVEKYPKWFYATKSGIQIKRISNNEIIYYSEIETPWPLDNRDYYGDLKITTDSGTRSLRAICIGIKDYLPVKKNLIRIPISKTTWYASAISSKLMHLVFFIELDPGGTVPAWIFNLFATKGPVETFKNLKQKMLLLNS